jgi:2',3'-cyclic-nucleotide 2'-phosphodiesterase (5'-nucleotidase family)
VTAGGQAGGRTIEPTQAPVEALRAVLPEVRQKADLVVVLADLEVSSIQPLVESGLDVDVVLGARSLTPREPTLIGKTVVASAGGSGRYVDKLTLTFTGEGSVAVQDFEEVVINESVVDDPKVAEFLQAN